MVWPLIAGLAAGGAALYGAYTSARSQERTNAMNQDMAREQMAFQERMSGSAYQRSMTDMKTAGLNPVLAYSQGGASSPTGAMSMASNPYANASSDYSNSAKAAFMESQMMKAALSKTASETELNKMAAAREASSIQLNQANAVLSGTNAKIAAYNLPAAQNMANLHDSAIGRYVLAPASAITSLRGNVFGGIASAAQGAKNWIAGKAAKASGWSTRETPKGPVFNKRGK